MCTAAVRPCVKCRCGRAPLPLIQVWRVLVNPLPPLTGELRQPPAHHRGCGMEEGWGGSVAYVVAPYLALTFHTLRPQKDDSWAALVLITARCRSHCQVLLTLFPSNHNNFPPSPSLPPRQ